MNSVEDRLRDAYAAATATVSSDNIEPLGARRSAGARLVAWNSRRVLAPLAAACAVALIVILAVVVVPGMRGPTTPRHPAGATLVPRYAVALAPSTLSVQNLVTGKIVARIASPRVGLAFWGLASGDGKNYVVELSRTRACRTWLYQFRLSRTGKPSALTPYRLPVVPLILEPIAVSRDNSMFAYAGTGCERSRFANDVSVVRLATMRTTTWGLPGSATVLSLSLTSDGRLAAFSLQPTSRSGSAAYSVATDAAPGPLLKRSRLIVTMPLRMHPTITSNAITPEGNALYFTTTQAPGARCQLRMADLATGRTRVIARFPTSLGACTMSADPTVRLVLAEAMPPIPSPSPVPTTSVQSTPSLSPAPTGSVQPTPSLSPTPTGSVQPTPSLSPTPTRAVSLAEHAMAMPALSPAASLGQPWLVQPTPTPSPVPTRSFQPTPSPSPSPTALPQDRLIVIDLHSGAIRYLSPAAPSTIYVW